MGRPDEARQLDAGAAIRRPQQDHLGARVRYADDGVQELAFQERAALDFETELDEERGHRVEVGQRDADMGEPPNA